MTRHPLRIAAVLTTAALLTTGLAPAATAAPAEVVSPQALTSATIADSSAGQQRWLSVAESRTVINPYYFGEASDGTSELAYTGGANLPVASAFYAHDKAVHVKETLTTYATGETPDPVLIDESFDSQPSGWILGNASANYSGGKVTVSNSGEPWGYLATPELALDPTVHSKLTVKIDATSPAGVGKWGIKIAPVGSGDDLSPALQPDTTDTGEFTYDLAAYFAGLGLSGIQTVRIRVWATTWETGQSNVNYTMDSFKVYQDESSEGGTPSAAATPATSVDYTWDPAADYSTGHYGSGDIKVTDYFSAGFLDGTVRKIEPTITGNPVVAGVIENSGSSYNSSTNVITIPGQWATRAIALPVGASVKFYSSKQNFLADSGATTTPQGGKGFWAATLPAGQTSYVGVGWAVNTGKSDDGELSHLPVWINPFPGGAAAEAAHFATGSRDESSAGISFWTTHWDDYMDRVPEVADYSIQRVDAGGITAAQMEAFYYRAFLNLEMNVLPATPETGNDYLQVGTGKPSLWMSGTPGTRNVASWDSLLGMQQLAYTNPRASWDSFIGMMNAVQMTGADPTDANGVSAKGALKGESLPSRKAQTAWILYSVTGDLEKLESIYDQLQANLIWSSHNMRWIYGSNNYTDERDSEFVASLIYDLKFGARIAELLGHSGDAATFNSLISGLTDDYEDWFFPTPGGTTPTFQTVQKVFLDSGRSESPWSDPTEGSDYRDHQNRWVKNGWSFYTTTALVAHELEPEYKAKVMNRFLRDYKADSQLAGLGDFAVKAPDIQLITYGLLDAAAWDAGSNAGYTWPAVTRAELIDAATVLVNAFNRDMVRSGFFAEVYEQTDPGTDVTGPIKSRGVRPSLFGVSHYIDNMWIANGYRVDEGDPTFVRLTGATGGLKGLTYMGKTFDLDIDGTQIKLSGPAVGGSVGLPATVDVSQIGEPVAPGTNPQDPSTDATLSALTYDGVTVPGFNTNNTSYDITLPAGTTAVPNVVATATDGHASVVVDPASALPGTSTVVVTAEDGIATRTYSINFTVASVGPGPDPVTPAASTVAVNSPVRTTYGKAVSTAVRVTAGSQTVTGSVVARAGSNVLASAAVTGGSATLTIPATLAAGSHNLEVVFTPADAATVAGSSTRLTVVVAKANAKVKKVVISKGAAGKSKKAKRSIKRGKVARVKVRLTAPVSLTGRVTVKAGKKTLGKAQIKQKGKKFIATIKVKKKASRKVKKTTKIRVIYAGNANVAKLKAKTNLRVIR